MKLGNKIRELRRKKGLTQDEFAKILGVSSKTVFRYEQGERMPTLQFLQALAHWAGVGLDWLIQKDDPLLRQVYDGGSVKEIELVRVPVLSGIAALGSGGLVEDYVKEYIHIARDIPLNPSAAYAVCAEGASMEPTIREGDIIVVDASLKDPKELEGKIVVARIEGTIAVKRLTLSANKYCLTSDNLSFQREPIPLNEEILLLGQVVAILRKLH